MDVYLDVVILLNFLIDFLLLMAANRLCGYGICLWRSALAAAIGGIYAGACFLPGFHFLGNLLWRTVSLFVMGITAYGLCISALRRSIVFAFLSMALGGIALGIGQGGFAGLVASAGVLLMLCVFGFQDRLGTAHYIPVELCYQGKTVKLTALKDTGNTLKDPVTGADVLVVAGQVAQQITGLTSQQIRNPVESVGSIPGLRLIPYRTVGQSSGLLLALRIPQVKIGRKWESRLVAFAPNSLCADGRYQALTGGNL